MLRAALTASLLTISATPEARPLPPELQAVRILEGSARLLVTDTPDSHLTLLPRGVYFTDRGYDALNIATQQLQANLKAMEGRVHDYERTALVPCSVIESEPIGPRWTLGEVVLVAVAGVLVGAGAVVVLQSARGP